MRKTKVAIIYDESDEQAARALELLFTEWGFETSANPVKNEIRMFRKSELNEVLGVRSSLLLYDGIISLVTDNSIKNVLFASYAAGAYMLYLYGVFCISLRKEDAESCQEEVEQLEHWVLEKFEIPIERVKDPIESFIALHQV